MMRRAMALVAGLTVLAAPALMAQEEQGDGAESRQRAPRAEMQERMQGHEMRQQGPGMQMGLDRMIGRLMDRQNELNLTDGQMSALGDLRDEAASALAPLREQMKTIHEGVRDGSMEREGAHDAMQGVHEQMQESMEGLQGQLGEILNDEQRAALRHGRAHGARRGRMQRQHKQMQERMEGQQAPPAPEAPAPKRG